MLETPAGLQFGLLHSVDRGEWASSTKKTLAPTCCASSTRAACSATKVSRLAASALSRRFLGHFSTNPKRCRACPRGDGGNSGNCCGSGRPRNGPAQICAPHSSSNWPSRGQPLLETPAPLPSVRSAALRRSRGEPPDCSKAIAPRTALAEDGNPPANGMGIPSQRLGNRHRSPALDQKPWGMPSFPLPGCRRPVHSPPQITSIQLPSFQKPLHLSDTQH